MKVLEIKTLSIADALPDATEAELGRLDGFFPALSCPYDPFQGWVIVQDRTVPKQTAKGVWLPDVTREMDKMRESVARIAAIGPLAGWDELSADYLPQWPWFHVGTFVKLSPHGAARWETEGDDGAEGVFRPVHFKDIIGGIKSVREVLR